MLGGNVRLIAVIFHSGPSRGDLCVLHHFAFVVLVGTFIFGPVASGWTESFVGSFWGVWRPTEPLVRFSIEDRGDGTFGGRAVGRNVGGSVEDALQFDLVPISGADRWEVKWIDGDGLERRSNPLRLVDTTFGPALAGDHATVGPNGKDLNGIIVIWFHLTARERPRLSPKRTPPDEVIEMDIDPARFRVWTSDDDLYGNAVRALTQTSDGYIWVGTIDGLSRFDGIQWENYGPQTDPSLPDGSVTSLLEDGEGRLIVATKESGLFSYEHNQFRSIASNSQIEGRWPNHLVEGQNGSIWFIMDQGRSLCRLAPDDGLTIWNSEDLLPYRSPSFQSQIGSVAVRDDRTLYLGTVAGPAVFDPATDDIVFRWLGIHTCSVVPVADGTVFGLTYLSLFSGDRELEFNDALGRRRIRKIVKTKGGDHWLIDDKALYRKEERRLIRYDLGKYLSPDLMCLMEDREGNIWVASATGGVGRYRESVIDYYNVTEWEENGQPRTVLPRDVGGVTFAADHRVIHWSPERIESEKFDREFLEQPTTANVSNYWNDVFHHECFVPDPSNSNHVYHGLALKGFRNEFRKNSLNDVEVPLVLLIDADGAQYFSHPSFPLGVEVGASIAAQKDGTVWYGTNRGVFRLENGVLEYWHDSSGVPEFKVSCIFVDRQDRVWIGSFESGGYLLHEDRVQRLEVGPHGLSSEGIRCVWETGDGTVWLGGQKGVTRVRSNEFNSLLQGAAFLSDSILTTVGDKAGNLWFGTSRGLRVVSESSLNDALDGQEHRLLVTRFGRLDGMGNEAVFPGYFPASCRDRDGWLYFCVQDGFVRVNPVRALSSVSDPLIAVTRLARSQEVYYDSDYERSSQPLLLPPEAQGVVQFRYSARSHAFPERIGYQYRIPEIDSNWTELGSQRQAVHPGLAPGAYQLELRAINHNGRMGEAKPIEFEVQPRFGQTTGFRSLLGAACVLGVGLVHRWRMGYRLRILDLEKRVEMDAERSRIARDIHDELGSGLAQIRLMSDIGPDARPTKKDADKISRLACESADRLREVIWSLSTGRETLENLGDFLHALAIDYFEESEIETRIQVENGEGASRELSPSTRRGIVLCSKGIMSNVLKYSNAGRFSLELRSSGDYLECAFSDDGVGFDPGRLRSGSLGLVLLRDRVEGLGGQFHLQTAIGKGTKILIELPWKSP